MRRAPSPARPRRSAGRFEQAEGGTLFLDEIGDMPMEAQTRLLRVLQQGEYTTVGGRVPIKTNVRIVAATNKDLRISIQQGLFREDLFFRLNVVPLRLPPLRERAEDVPDLARHFFALVEKEGLPRKQLDVRGHGPAQALPLARQRPRARKPRAAPRGALSAGHDHRRRSSRRSSITPPLAPAAPAGKRPRNGRFGRPRRPRSSGTWRSISPASRTRCRRPGSITAILREIEGPLIGAALAATRGNQIRAAELLGVNRNTLRKKVRDLDLQVIRTGRRLGRTWTRLRVMMRRESWASAIRKGRFPT